MRLVFVICLFICNVAGAASYYVSPTGTGDGSLANPWPLENALTNAVLLSGDTVWLRVGTYSNDYTGTVSGLTTNPITFRNYNGERAILDGSLSMPNSSNVWLWGLEVIDSNKTNRTAPFNTISGMKDGTKVINCLIHDCCIGLAGQGMDEAYGNVMWYCGKSATEHPIYWQNARETPRAIENNLIGFTSGFGIHLYSEAGELKNFQILSNSVWGSGDFVELGTKADILLGGGQPVTNGLIRGNNLYNPGGRGIQLGYSVQNSNAVITWNRAHSKFGFWLNNPINQLTFASNIISSPTVSVITINTAPPLAGSHSWDYNEYAQTYSAWTNQFVRRQYSDGTSTNLAWWQSNYGFDANSTFTNVYPQNTVVVVPNKYEAKRAHITIWNLGRSNSVSVNVSSVLSAGDTFTLRSAYDYWGTPVASGTFDGNPIPVTMTNLAVQTPANWNVTVIQSTTNFAAFVLLGAAPSRRLHANTARAGRIIPP